MVDYAQFEKRVASVNTKHQKLSRGYTAKIDDTGLIQVEPKRERSFYGLRIIVFIVAGVLLVKSLMISSVGIATYENRIQELSAGMAVEQAAAWVMQPDRLSRYVAENITKLIP
ncbi:hypothetical protein [Roseobacter sp.]|uniref:hypothetical protein n=1 Tax=Roseobacter sp. TaxID=1907202 RepID=UPI0038586046